MEISSHVNGCVCWLWWSLCPKYIHSFPNKYSKKLNSCEFFLIFYNNMFLCASAIQCLMWQGKMKIPQFGVKMKSHKLVGHKTNLPNRHILFDKHNVSKNYLTPSIKWLGDFVKKKKKNLHWSFSWQSKDLEIWGVSLLCELSGVLL